MLFFAPRAKELPSLSLEYFFWKKKLIPIFYEMFIVPGSSREATDSEEKVGQGLDFVKTVAFPIFTSRVWEIHITYMRDLWCRRNWHLDLVRLSYSQFFCLFTKKKI